MTYDKELIKLEAKKELARRDFWHYCKLLGKKDFYNDKKEYLKDLCNQLQSFIEDFVNLIQQLYFFNGCQEKTTN